MAFTAPRTWTDGELVTASIMNTHIRDNQLSFGPHLIARKTSDQSVTSSTTLVSDTALLLAVGSTDVWLVKAALRFDGDTAGDLKLSWQLPTSGVFDFHVAYRTSADSNDIAIAHQTTSDTFSTSMRCSGAGTTELGFIDGIYIGGGTAGNLTMRWAQVTSSATATRVLTNSTLWAVKLA